MHLPSGLSNDLLGDRTIGRLDLSLPPRLKALPASISDLMDSWSASESGPLVGRDCTVA